MALVEVVNRLGTAMAKAEDELFDFVVAMLMYEATIDGSREAFIADGGNPAEIHAIERAFGVGVFS